MRLRITIVFILLVVGYTDIISQPCPPGGIIFYTQSQVDSFPMNYPGCQIIEGGVQIGENLWIPTITNLDSLSVLTSIEGNLKILYNAITDLSGLQNLSSIGGSILILNNNSLSSLNGLEGLSFIGGDIVFHQNFNLVDLTGMGMLDTLQNGLNINLNYSLVDLSGLESITHIKGNISIRGNESIVNFNGLDNLKLVNGDISIRNNTNLVSFTNLNSLEKIGGFLQISGNNSLSSLEGLNNLDSIGGLLEVSKNESLISLGGIDNISSASITHLSIYENSSLEICDVQSVCYYLAFSQGTVVLYDNAQGCNSKQEIKEACKVGVPEMPEARELSTYPNPFTTSTTIEYELSEPTHIQLTIFNHLGEAVEEAVSAFKLLGVHTYEWNAERLSEGMYFAVLRSEDGVSVTKLIKR